MQILKKQLNLSEAKAKYDELTAAIAKAKENIVDTVWGAKVENFLLTNL